MGKVGRWFRDLFIPPRPQWTQTIDCNDPNLPEQAKAGCAESARIIEALKFAEVAYSYELAVQYNDEVKKILVEDVQENFRTRTRVIVIIAVVALAVVVVAKKVLKK